MTEIEQKEIDALGARILHNQRLAKYRSRSARVDFLALAVPATYLVFRFLAKGTEFERPVELLWELLAGALFVVVLGKLAYKWSDKVEEHSRLMGENTSLISQAKELLREGQSLSPATLRAFILLADSIERQDRSSLADATPDEHMKAYREALKEFGGSSVTCPICHASPFRFTKGSCQQCGNTPK